VWILVRKQGAMTMPFPLLPLALAGVLMLAAAIPTAAAGDVVEMRFEGYVAGLHVVSTQTVIEETPVTYLIRGAYETAGLGAVFASRANHSEARGRKAGGRPQPESFASETTSSGVVQRDRVDYRPDGPANGSSTPAAEPVTAVDAKQLTGTVDSLTAYLLVERQVARGGGCALTVPVFDGRHRYNLRFSDAGNQILSAAAGQKFAGTAHACRMVRDEIGGFFVDKNHVEGAPAGTIWYAQLMPGDLATPVRMEMETEIGAVSIYLSQLRGRGVNLQLME
jgi:hypothetical protein